MSERSSMESVKESLKLTFLSLGVKLDSLRLTRRGGGQNLTLWSNKKGNTDIPRAHTHTHTSNMSRFH